MLEFIKNQKIKFSFFLVFVFLFSCDQNHKPKPKGFQRYTLPIPQHETINFSDYYLFEKNKIAKPELNKDLGWLNLSYKKEGAEILITFKQINTPQDLSLYIKESYKLINRHKVKANSILETNIKTIDGKHAVLIDIKGEVASPFQFITTDSSKNFLRAALYFEKPIKGDSLSPIVDYLKKDMLHVLNTLQWNE